METRPYTAATRPSQSVALRSPGRADDAQHPIFQHHFNVQPPSSLECEQALLGAILANNTAFHRVIGFLKPEHFADPIHGRIYTECARLILRGRPVDALTLRAAFDQSGMLDEVGGTPYIAKLLTAMVGIINAGEYGHTIHDAWLRRQLIAIGQDIVALGYGADPGVDGETQIGLASDALMQLTAYAQKEAPTVSVGDAARLAVSQAEAVSRGDIRGIQRSGLASVDAAVGDWWPGHLYILGGRPAMGKSSLALQVAIGVARQLKREQDAAPPFTAVAGIVVFFTLEMPAQQLGGWAACQIAGVDNAVLRGRAMNAGEAEAMLLAQRELDGLPLEFIDAAGMSGPAIALRCRALNQRRRVRMVLVDHVQKVVSGMVSADGRATETSLTARTTSALKDLSRHINAPVVALFQLGRDVDKRDNPRPRQSDLMYGGEADADVIALLFREERYLQRQPPERFAKGESDAMYENRVSTWRNKWAKARGRAELIVPKARSGAESVTRLGFAGVTTSFYELGPEAADDGAAMPLWEDI